jgi:uncharacterized membrane protein YdjX (TVP38/TMEM64 family)
MAHRRNLRRHFLILGMLIIAAGLIAASDTLHGKSEAIVFWAEGMISQAPLLGMLVFVLLAMISAMVAFFSSALLVPVAVYAWGKTACLALLWCGWLLGGVAAFCIGRFFGRSVASMIIGEETIDNWENQVSKRTRFIHILMFQALVPSEVPGYLLGILRYRFLFYLTALAITEMPYAVATVYLGESFLRGDSTIIILVGIGAIVLAAFLVQIHRRLIRPREENKLRRE